MCKSWETPTTILANIATVIGVAIAVAALIYSKPIINNISFLVKQDDTRTAENQLKTALTVNDADMAKAAVIKLEKYPEYSGVSERLEKYEASSSAPAMMKSGGEERAKTYQYILNGIGTLP